MLGKLSIAGAVAAILHHSYTAAAQSEALLLTPALLFVVPSFGVSRPRDLAVRAASVYVSVPGTVRRPKPRRRSLQRQ